MKCLWKTNFFPGRATAIFCCFFFAFHSTYTVDTPYRVCFDWNKSLTRWKRPFLNIPFSRTPTKSSVWKPNFLTKQATAKIYFVLHSTYTGNTPYRVWFDFNNSLTRWKRPIFKIRRNSHFAKFAKFRKKTQLFFRASYTKIFFVLHSTYTDDTPCQIWYDFDNSLTQSKRTILKIRYPRKSKSFVWNAYEILTFFLGEL